ncbi:hypothetical protein Vretimale_14263, partial [Volvox reticuliferus]
SSLHGLSAVLLGRKTRCQSQMRTTRNVPLQDPDNLMGYVSETMSTSVTATVISLSHTLLQDALHSQPPSGTAVRSCADTHTGPGRGAHPGHFVGLCGSRFGAGRERKGTARSNLGVRKRRSNSQCHSHEWLCAPKWCLWCCLKLLSPSESSYGRSGHHEHTYSSHSVRMLTRTARRAQYRLSPGWLRLRRSRDATVVAR